MSSSDGFGLLLECPASSKPQVVQGSKRRTAAAIGVAFLAAGCSPNPDAQPGPMTVIVGDTTWHLDPDTIGLSIEYRRTIRSASDAPVRIEGFSVDFGPDGQPMQRTLLSVSTAQDALRPYSYALRDAAQRPDVTPIPGANYYPRSGHFGFKIVYFQRDAKRHFDFVDCQSNRLTGVNNQDMGFTCRGFLALGLKTTAIAQFQSRELTRHQADEQFRIVSAFISSSLERQRS